MFDIRKYFLIPFIIILNNNSISYSFDQIFFRNGKIEDVKIIDTLDSKIKIKEKKNFKTYEKRSISKIIFNGDTIEYKLTLADTFQMRTSKARQTLCTDSFECENFRNCNPKLTSLQVIGLQNGEYYINQKIVTEFKVIEETTREETYSPTYFGKEDGHMSFDGVHVKYKVEIKKVILGNKNLHTEFLKHIAIMSKDGSINLKPNNDYIADIIVATSLENCEVTSISFYHISNIFEVANGLYKLVYSCDYPVNLYKNNGYSFDEVISFLLHGPPPLTINKKGEAKKVEKDYRKPISFLTGFVLVNFAIFGLPFIILRN